MTTKIRIRFKGVGPDFRATRWRLPSQTDCFRSLPPNATSLFVPAENSLFIDRPGDRRRQEVAFRDVRSGLSDDGYTSLVFARVSKKFCFRLLFNAERDTDDICSETCRTYKRLVRDAQFHSDHLGDAEGLMVPVHYGVWPMNTGDWVGKVLFSIAQYCGVA
ncbi:hypothetical protein DFH08DRAFT_22753 [Mycena albidolilacea]|uniref:Uncharacterized protein n=1 Tax=Mycena albidolilacea TaxID=1033008 RepID=A0AAD7AV25_9AGAR|nr:hypothetical protein DFH08DRAFT_22753 [Mycena albidolilacea]